MIDLGYSALKDSLDVLRALKKKYKNDQYTEEVEKQLKKISEKYDELLSEYKKVISEKKTEINLEKEHYDILKKIVDCDFSIGKMAVKSYVKTNGLDYEIAFRELEEDGYLVGWFIGRETEYFIPKTRKAEVLKFFRDFEKLNREDG